MSVTNGANAVSAASMMRRNRVGRSDAFSINSLGDRTQRIRWEQ
jgi:hypothetical protein